MDATRPHKFIGFGAMDATKPYEFIWFGAMYATRPYKFRGLGANLVPRKLLSAGNLNLSGPMSDLTRSRRLLAASAPKPGPTA